MLSSISSVKNMAMFEAILTMSEFEEWELGRKAHAHDSYKR